MVHHKDRIHTTNIKPAKDGEDKHGEGDNEYDDVETIASEVSVESDVKSDIPVEAEKEAQGIDDPENDESEEDNALESAKYETQDPFNDIGHIMLEPTV